jgi:hypothetical protein
MSVKSFKTSGVGVDLAPQGLVLINTTSFSGLASQSVNNVFTTTYDDYLILIEIKCSVANERPLFRLRVGGVDSSANYYAGQVGRGSNATNYDSQNNAGSSHDFNPFSDLNADGNPNFYKMHLQNPASAVRTMGVTESSVFWPSTINAYMTGSMAHNVATAYDGFTILRNGLNATFAGSIKVYGVNK